MTCIVILSGDHHGDPHQPPCAAEFEGNLPAIQTEAWQGPKPAEQRAHVESGLVKIEGQWGRASSGRVTVKTF